MMKKKVKQAIVILTSLFLCTILIFGAAISLGSFDASVNTVNAFAAEDSDDVYISDLKATSVKVGSGVLNNDKAPDNTKLTVKIEGSWYSFDKGIWAHAASIVVYNIADYDYQYFTAYAGLNKSATKSDGVFFRVETSTDGTNWTEKTDTILAVQNQNAIYFKVDISGASYLRLIANQNKNNAHDHAVWADAKLTNSPDGGVESLESYDEQIRAKVANADLDDKQANLFADKQLEKLVLQREFVSRVGQFTLKKFTTQCNESQEGVSNEDNKAVLNWLLNEDLDSLREFILGGAPFGGSYYNSLIVLSKLYKHYKTDLDDERPLTYNKWVPGRTYGELYRTMMFSVALTHDKTIGSYLQASRVENQSDPLRRYAIYRYMYETERFVATRDNNGNAAYETMNLFGSLKVEEMRWIMSNIIDDESILWLNDYVQTRINASPGSAGNLHTPHSYVKYTDPNYNNPVFYAEDNYDYFNTLFQVDGRDAYINGEQVEANAGKKSECGIRYIMSLPEKVMTIT